MVKEPVSDVEALCRVDQLHVKLDLQLFIMCITCRGDVENMDIYSIALLLPSSTKFCINIQLHGLATCNDI